MHLPIKTDLPSNLKELILLAWKKRWTPLEWDLMSREVLEAQNIPRIDAAKALLKHAFIGMVPNQLIFSYFSHDVASKLLSPCEAVESIVEFEQFQKTNCILALLEVIKSIKLCSSRIDLTIDNPIRIASCHFRLLYWYSGVLSDCCAKLADLKSSQVHASILEETLARAKKIIYSPFERSLLILSLVHTMSFYSELSLRLRELDTLFRHFVKSGVPSITPEIKEALSSFLSELSNAVARLELPKLETADSSPMKFQTYGSIYGAIAVEALLRPESDGKKLIKQLVFLKRLKGLTMSELYCEILRGSYLGLESSSKENTKWDAFFFVRLPMLIGILHQIRSSEGPEYQATSNDLVEAVEHLLHQAIQLITVCDTKWQCNTLELLMSEIGKKTGLLSDDLIQLLINKKNGLSSGVVRPSNRENITHVLLSMGFADSLLRSLDEETKRQEVILDVLTKMLPSYNTLEIVCTAVAAGGRLPQFTTRFIRLNEMACLPGPEASRSGLARANLFDISFLMLCYIMQNYGMHLVLQGECINSFFCDWAQEHLVSRSTSDEDSIGSYLDQVLTQYLGNDVDPRSAQIRWPDQCVQVVCVMKEILVAWSTDVISENDAIAYTRMLRKYMMSLAVCAAVYLANRYQTWPEPQRSRAFILLECLGSPPIPEELALADKKERLILMSVVINNIINEVKPKEVHHNASTVTQSLGTFKPLEKIFRSCWSDAVSIGYVDQLSIARFDSLLSTAGPIWYTTEVFKACVNETHCLDSQRALEVAFSAISLSSVPCCIALASKVVPDILSSRAEA
ncbi:hypothetical protein QYM36_000203, partial [Artemia franciscana]